MKDFPEQAAVFRLADRNHPRLRTLELGRVPQTNHPLLGFSIGATAKDTPVFGVFAGVHGLEKVGTHVALAFIHHLLAQAEWDGELAGLLEHNRVVAIPLVNPGGMAHNTRSNPRGVDLMRNAPQDLAADALALPLVSGHRIGPWLPWYRGVKDGELEPEARILVDFVQEHMFGAPCAMSLDLHSGFGLRDRLWYPYSRTPAPFPDIQRVRKLRALLDDTLPHHVYKVEPQSDAYVIHGDLWDHLYDAHQTGPHQQGATFIPWTLEMGSWNWVRKNPLQLLTSGGLFNPFKAHRHDRTMRRHLLLLDFLFRATRNAGAWS